VQRMPLPLRQAATPLAFRLYQRHPSNNSFSDAAVCQPCSCPTITTSFSSSCHATPRMAVMPTATATPTEACMRRGGRRRARLCARSTKPGEDEAQDATGGPAVRGVAAATASLRGRRAAWGPHPRYQLAISGRCRPCSWLRLSWGSSQETPVLTSRSAKLRAQLLQPLRISHFRLHPGHCGRWQHTPPWCPLRNAPTRRPLSTK